MSQFTSPHVLKLHGLCVRPPAVCLVLEYCHYGAVADLIAAGGHADLPLTWQNLLLIMLQCAQGLAVVHDNLLTHNDIKAANFLVTYEAPKLTNTSNTRLPRSEQKQAHDSAAVSSSSSRFVFPVALDESESISESNCNFLVKIADLELSSRVRSPSSPPSPSFVKNNTPQSLLSISDAVAPETINWTAPEVLLGSVGAFSPQADCYALASTFFEIVYNGRVPFAEESTQMDRDALIARIGLPLAYRPRLTLTTQMKLRDAKLSKRYLYPFFFFFFFCKLFFVEGDGNPPQKSRQ